MLSALSPELYDSIIVTGDVPYRGDIWKSDAYSLGKPPLLI